MIATHRCDIEEYIERSLQNLGLETIALNATNTGKDRWLNAERLQRAIEKHEKERESGAWAEHEPLGAVQWHRA